MQANGNIPFTSEATQIELFSYLLHCYNSENRGRNIKLKLNVYMFLVIPATPLLMADIVSELSVVRSCQLSLPKLTLVDTI